MTLTRRTFLSRSSIGVAIAGGLALGPMLLNVFKTQSASAAKTMPVGLMAAGPTEPLVAHVRDITSGEISLLVGTNQGVIRDMDLAARLYAAARR